MGRAPPLARTDGRVGTLAATAARILEFPRRLPVFRVEKPGLARYARENRGGELRSEVRS
jgi:hypothetical protein